jgi:tetraacyldisaccharide 4'-kinase
MQNPKFWYLDNFSNRLLAKILSPLGWLIYGVSKFRFLGTAGYNGKTPIICIGNATVGGTGKTPTAILMANLAVSLGLKPAFLTRGYGGTIIKPYRVQATDTAQKTGDEALILMNHAPCFIAKNRVLGADYIDKLNEFDLIITDDGLQNHPSLHKDCVILTVDANRFFGNNHLMPAGALREPAQSAINKAQYIILMGQTHIENIPQIITNSGKEIIYAYKKPLVHGADLAGENVIVFSGLGNNSQFIKTIKNTGANIIETQEFPDHFVYDNRIIERLIKKAQHHAALLVTTEKDMVKISPHYYPYIVPFLITLDICDDDKKRLCDMITKLCGKR